jgi:hypothetical protein
LTRLTGFVDPYDLVRMSLMPAISHTARTEGAGDDARAGRGRQDAHHRAAVEAFDLVRDRAGLRERHAHEVLAAVARRLLDRAGDLAGLAEAVAHDAPLVADHLERGEGEAAAALHHAGGAVSLSRGIRRGLRPPSFPSRRDIGSWASSWAWVVCGIRT